MMKVILVEGNELNIELLTLFPETVWDKALVRVTKQVSC